DGHRGSRRVAGLGSAAPRVPLAAPRQALVDRRQGGECTSARLAAGAGGGRPGAGARETGADLIYERRPALGRLPGFAWFRRARMRRFFVFFDMRQITLVEEAPIP